MSFSFKKKISKIFSIVSVSAFFACVFSACLTLGWYVTDNQTQAGVNGNVHGSYFESGDGSKDKPFEIARPIQLYYLSWLQEMGFFNQPAKDEDGNLTSEIKQYYFFLSQDLDMSSYVLPPVGTETYPFIGEFDGRGKTITNLTISNNVASYTDDPYKETTTGAGKAYEILGMFGVVGSMNEDSSVIGALESDTGNLVPDTTNSYTYDSSVNSLSDFYLENVIIQTQTTQSLVGAVAGYVNAPITGVGVDKSTITVTSSTPLDSENLTANISDYSIIGYCTQKFRSAIQIVDNKIYSPNANADVFVTESKGNAWGGSINMKVLLNRINSLKTGLARNSTNRTSEPYNVSETVINNPDGTETRVTGNTSTTSFNRGNGTAYSYSNATNGSYYFRESDSTKAYVGGQSDFATSKVSTYISYGNGTETTYLIRNGNTGSNNYYRVTANGNTLTLATNSTQANASKWHYDATNKLVYTIITKDGNPCVVYLCLNGANIGVDYAPNVNIELNNGIFRYIGYYLKSGNNYIRINDNNNGITTQNATSDRARWYFPITNFTFNVDMHVINNGTNYYFNYAQNGGAGQQTNISQNLDNSWRNPWTVVKNGTTQVALRITNASGQYLNGSGSFSNSATYFTISTNTINIGTGSDQTTDTKATITNIATESSGGVSYIPLSVAKDSGWSKDEDYKPSDFNTGYITGGAYDKFNGGNQSIITRDRAGDVRISPYALSNISNGYSTSNKSLKSIYTIRDNTKIEIDKANYSYTSSGTKYDLVQFKQASTNLVNILKSDSSNVYGIHFMDASIDIHHVFTAPSVYVNKETKTNFDLPEDCVDFFLKEKGFITFFAGNYHGDNNSFFTLNKIERSETNKINAIHRIKYVYGSNDVLSAPYIYAYADGDDINTITGYSDGINHGTNADSFSGSFVDANGDTISCTYTKKFNTDWIGYQPNIVTRGGKDIFYFEIPVNDGEYALGSVPGACGGYLIYLDISAASQTIHRVQTNEMFVETVTSYELPNGVSYVTSSEDEVDDNDSVAVAITGSGSGSYSIDRSDDNITFSGDQNTTKVVFLGDGLSFSGTPPGGLNDMTVTKTIRKITDYDYNDVTGMYTKQITIVESIGTGASTKNTVTTTFFINSVCPTSLDDYTQIAKYSFEFTGENPVFSYKYFLHNEDGVLELIYNSKQDLTVTALQLADGYSITTDAGETFAEAVNQECTVSKNDSVTDEELDTWASFGNSYTNVHYVYTDNDTLEVEYDFSSSQVYNSVKDPLNNDQGDLKITDNYYTVTFTVTSGTEPIDVTVTNAGNNTFRNSSDSTATVSFSYKASLTFMPAQDVVIAFNDAYTSNSNKKIRKSVEL